MKPYLSLLLCSVLFFAGCGDMQDQPRYEPLEKSTFYADGMSARPYIAGTVARGQLKEDDHLNLGQVDGKTANTFPFPITMDVLKRGQNRYNIYCSVCHDASGSGNGMVVQRGFPKPPSLQDERLIDAPVGYLFEVISNGFGRMAGYRKELSPEDRWAVISYIRSLQLSAQAHTSLLNASDLDQLNHPHTAISSTEESHHG